MPSNKISTDQSFTQIREQIYSKLAEGKDSGTDGLRLKSGETELYLKPGIARNGWFSGEKTERKRAEKYRNAVDLLKTKMNSQFKSLTGEGEGMGDIVFKQLGRDPGVIRLQEMRAIDQILYETLQDHAASGPARSSAFVAQGIADLIEGANGSLGADAAHGALAKWESTVPMHASLRRALAVDLRESGGRKGPPNFGLTHKGEIDAILSKAGVKPNAPIEPAHLDALQSEMAERFGLPKDHYFRGLDAIRSHLATRTKIDNLATHLHASDRALDKVLSKLPRSDRMELKGDIDELKKESARLRDTMALMTRYPLGNHPDVDRLLVGSLVTHARTLDVMADLAEVRIPGDDVDYARDSKRYDALSELGGELRNRAREFEDLALSHLTGSDSVIPREVRISRKVDLDTEANLHGYASRMPDFGAPLTTPKTIYKRNDLSADHESLRQRTEAYNGRTDDARNALRDFVDDSQSSDDALRKLDRAIKTALSEGDRLEQALRQASSQHREAADVGGSMVLRTTGFLGRQARKADASIGQALRNVRKRQVLLRQLRSEVALVDDQRNAKAPLPGMHLIDEIVRKRRALDSGDERRRRVSSIDSGYERRRRVSSIDSGEERRLRVSSIDSDDERGRIGSLSLSDEDVLENLPFPTPFDEDDAARGVSSTPDETDDAPQVRVDERAEDDLGENASSVPAAKKGGAHSANKNDGDDAEAQEPPGFSRLMSDINKTNERIGLQAAKQMDKIALEAAVNQPHQIAEKHGVDEVDENDALQQSLDEIVADEAETQLDRLEQGLDAQPVSDAETDIDEVDEDDEPLQPQDRIDLNAASILLHEEAEDRGDKALERLADDIDRFLAGDIEASDLKMRLESAEISPTFPQDDLLLRNTVSKAKILMQRLEE